MQPIQPATPAPFPDVSLTSDWPADRYTAVVALTHDPKIDDFALTEALRTGCFYIGALGSRKTHAARIERLSSQGFNHDALAAIHAPVGLNIGASPPRRDHRGVKDASAVMMLKDKTRRLMRRLA